MGEDGGGAEKLQEGQGEGDHGAVLGAETVREGGVPEAEEGEGQCGRAAGENQSLRGATPVIFVAGEGRGDRVGSLLLCICFLDTR